MTIMSLPNWVQSGWENPRSLKSSKKKNINHHIQLIHLGEGDTLKRACHDFPLRPASSASEISGPCRTSIRESPIL
jgi:hypothetical protein